MRRDRDYNLRNTKKWPINKSQEITLTQQRHLVAQQRHLAARIEKQIKTNTLSPRKPRLLIGPKPKQIVLSFAETKALIGQNHKQTKIKVSCCASVSVRKINYHPRVKSKDVSNNESLATNSLKPHFKSVNRGQVRPTYKIVTQDSNTTLRVQSAGPWLNPLPNLIKHRDNPSAEI